MRCDLRWMHDAVVVVAVSDGETQCSKVIRIILPSLLVLSSKGMPLAFREHGRRSEVPNRPSKLAHFTSSQGRWSPDATCDG